MGTELELLNEEWFEQLGEEEKQKIRRRVEDVLRKQPKVLMKIALMMIHDKSIKVRDLL